MSQNLKNLLSEAEDLLQTLLNEGMTNGQALKKIKQELGDMAKEHAQQQLIMWWREDNGI